MWEDLKALAPWAGLLVALVVLAATERLRRTFLTKEEAAAKDRQLDEMSERLDGIEARERQYTEIIRAVVKAEVGEMAVKISHDVSEHGKRLERYVTLTLGNGDRLADHHAKIQLLDSKIETVARYGSEPTRRSVEMLSKLTTRLALVMQKLGIPLDDDK